MSFITSNKRLYRRLRTHRRLSIAPGLYKGTEIQQQVPIRIFMGALLRSKLEHP
jgi:hypothetical protein